LLALIQQLEPLDRQVILSYLEGMDLPRPSASSPDLEHSGPAVS